MKVILHIGTDKTGSTAIQSSLPGNREWLLAHAVYLPLVGLGADNGHSALLSELDAGQLDALKNELRQARDAGFASAVLSWEGMVRFSGSQIRTLARALAGYELTVLVYVRDQAELIQSAHLQWVRMHAGALGIRSIAEPSGCYQRAVAFAFLRDPRRNYYRTLRRWERAIPGARFSVRPFYRETLARGDVVVDFLQQLGIGDDTGFVHVAKLTNPSLDVESALLLQAWKRDPAGDDTVDTLQDVTESVLAEDGASSRYFLDKRAVSAIRRHFRRCNRQLASRYMPGASFPFPAPVDCWRTEAFAAIETRAQTLSDRVMQVNRIPTLTGDDVSGSDLPARVDLFVGWSEPEHWGVWSIGERSCLRFRLHQRLLNHCDTHLQIRLKGHYYTGIKSSRVLVNGRDLGDRELSLAHQAISLPLSALLPFSVVEICLLHARPPEVSSAAHPGENRPLAFALLGISVEPASLPLSESA